MNSDAALETRGPIVGEEDFLAVQALLTRRSAGPAALRTVMRLFESYRAARKYGWSRPWNKGGLKTFLTLEFSPEKDSSYMDIFRGWVKFAGTGTERGTEQGTAHRSREEALNDLAQRPFARAFAFLHERVDAEGAFEGFTLGLGAVSPHGKRFRDRFDVVVERPIDGQAIAAKIRLYDDPYIPRIGAVVFPKPLLVSLTHLDEDANRLLVESLDALRAGALDARKHWTHWTQDVIDAFGPRRFEAKALWFGTAVLADAHARLKKRQSEANE